MAEITRIEPLESGGERRIYADGRIVEVDESGKITGGKLPSDVARRISQGRSLKAKEARSDDVASVLMEFGLDETSTTNRALAEMFLTGGSGAVSAIRELKKQAGGAFKDDNLQAHEVEVWSALDVIRVDGVLYRKLDAPELLELVELLRDAKRQKAMDATNIADSEE